MTIPLKVYERLNGIENMRLDEELLFKAESGTPGCRVYAWDGPWVTLGRFQSSISDLVDPQYPLWVQRPTGGKAVLHGHDVTVGLGIPLSLLFPEVQQRGIKPIYRAVVEPIVEALNACGLPAALAENTSYSNRGRHTADCFAFSSPNDIVNRMTGQKVCGCALRITDKSVLVQASIPNGPPLVDPVSVIVNADRGEYQAWDAKGFSDALRSALTRLGYSRPQ